MAQANDKKIKPPPVMMQRKGYMYVRLPYTAGYDELLADQRIQFGEPCIRGTRIPATSIYRRYVGGDTILMIAKDYNIKKRDVRVAIAYVEGRCDGDIPK